MQTGAGGEGKLLQSVMVTPCPSPTARGGCSLLPSKAFTMEQRQITDGADRIRHDGERQRASKQ